MRRVVLAGRGELAEWRDAARAFAVAGILPEEIECAKNALSRVLRFNTTPCRLRLPQHASR